MNPLIKIMNDASGMLTASNETMRLQRATIEALQARVIELEKANSDLASAAIVPDGYQLTPVPAAPTVPEGWKLVPVEPTEAMWGELARDIVGWLYSAQAPHHGAKLHTHLKNLGRDIPEWLAKEIPDVAHTPAKGNFAVAIYKAMLAAAKGGV